MRHRYRHSAPWSSLDDAWSRPKPDSVSDFITLRDGHSRNHGRLPARDPIYLVDTLADEGRMMSRPLDRLLAILARLRDPERGCPWDREQDFATIAPYTI